MMGDGWQIKMIKSRNNEATIKGSKASTRYTVKVRGIVKVDRTRYYGGWSKPLKIKTAR